MRKVLHLLRKDLIRRRRAPLGVVVMIAFPLIFATMLAVIFGTGGEGSGLPRAKILVEDRDGGLAGRLLLGAFTSDEMRDYVEVVQVGEEGRQMMDDGEASALLIVPEGMTEALLDGEPVTLQLVRNPEQVILPEIAEQITGVLADVLGLGTRLVHRQAEIMGIDDLSAVDLMDLSEEDFSRFAVAARRAGQVIQDLFEGPPLTYKVMELAKEDEEDEQDDEDTPLGLLIFLMILPGISSYSLFIIGDQTMRDILTEATAGTLSRQLSAPIDVGHVIAAKVLVSVMVGAVALVVLSAVAAFVVPRGVDAAGFAVLALALLLSASGFSAFIYGAASTERQGSAAAGVLYLILAFAGGSFVNFEGLPAVVQKISPFSPFYWSTEGFKDLLLRDAGLVDVALHAAILGGLGLTLLAAGSWLLQRKVLKGATS